MDRSLLTKSKRAFLSGYALRCIYGLYLALKARNKSTSTLLSALRQIVCSLEHVKLGLTFAASSATHAWLTRNLSVNCKQSETSAIDKKELCLRSLAVVLSLAWSKALPKQLREMVVLHLFVRAVHALIKLLKYDAHYAILPRVRHDEIFVGAVPFTVLGYGIYHNPRLFDGKFYDFILKWGSNTHQQIGAVFRSQRAPCSTVIFKLTH